MNEKLLTDAGYSAVGREEDGGIFVSGRGRCVLAAEHEFVLEMADDWQWMVANTAVSRVLGVQSESLFFHGAAIGFGGKGVFILGATGSGKTTLALALAARGHSFLSDEVAGVVLESRRGVPFRRAPLVRSGPAASTVVEVLGPWVEDRRGSPRQCAPVSELFPQATVAEAVVTKVVVLRSFASETMVEPFQPSLSDLWALNPLVCSMFCGNPSQRALQMLEFVRGVDCFYLDSASPDAGADSIEGIMEGVC